MSKKNLLWMMLGLLCLNSSVRASENWVRYETNETADLFVDLDSIRKIDGVTSYRVLMNPRKIVSPMASVILLNEMKCSERQARFISSSSYSEKYGRGRVVATMTASMLGPDAYKFSPISFGAAEQFSIVCNP